MKRPFCTIAVLVLTAPALRAENGVRLGEFIIEPPPLICLGFEWAISAVAAPGRHIREPPSRWREARHDRKTPVERNRRVHKLSRRCIGQNWQRPCVKSQSHCQDAILTSISAAHERAPTTTTRIVRSCGRAVVRNARSVITIARRRASRLPGCSSARH